MTFGRVLLAGGLILFLGFLGLLGIVFLAFMGLVWPTELAAYLLGGWFLFLRRVGGEVTVSFSAMASAVAALAALSIGLHVFLRSLANASHNNEGVERSDEGPSGPRAAARWSAGWTAAIVGIVMLMFTAGVCFIGVTHQLVWMARSPEPMISNSFYEVVGRSESANNLKQLGLALSDHQSALTTMPAGATIDARGRLLHSWMTALLPYMEHQTLYERIDKKLTWDDESNASAFREAVEPYLTGWTARQPTRPRENEDGYALTDYAANVHVMGSDRPRSLESISDGKAHTILAGEAFTNRKAWGEPGNWRDPAAGLNKSPDGFGSPWRRGAGGVLFLHADGHAKMLTDDIDPQVLRAMATPDGGETIPAD